LVPPRSPRLRVSSSPSGSRGGRGGRLSEGDVLGSAGRPRIHASAGSSLSIDPCMRYWVESGGSTRTPRLCPVFHRERMVKSSSLLLSWFGLGGLNMSLIDPGQRRNVVVVGRARLLPSPGQTSAWASERNSHSGSTSADERVYGLPEPLVWHSSIVRRNQGSGGTSPSRRPFVRAMTLGTGGDALAMEGEAEAPARPGRRRPGSLRRPTAGPWQRVVRG
jgi:hypothetical protein